MKPTYEELEAKYAALAMENVGLKSKGREILKEAGGVYERFNTEIDRFVDGQTLHEFQLLIEEKSPETDKFAAEMKTNIITRVLDVCTDYLDTDCVMDRLGISYEEAEVRTAGAMDFHNAIVEQLREVGQ